jgi:hypothetical protein
VLADMLLEAIEPGITKERRQEIVSGAPFPPFCG